MGLGTPAALQQPIREITALTQLRDGDVQGPGAGVEVPVPVPVAGVHPISAWSAVFGAADSVCLGPHQGGDERLERTIPGLASARARGRKGGRPFKMTPAKVRLAMASMGQPGTKVGELCAELGITHQTLYRHVSPTGELRPDGVRLLNPK